MDAVLGAATLAGLRHDFREQLRLGLEAQRLQPGLVRALPVIADAQIELGRYGAAERTLQRMLDLKPNLASYSRVSYFRELHGDLGGAVEAMRLAVSAGGGAPENVAYVQVLLGDLELQRGRPDAARLAYTSALRSVPGYPAGLVGLARADAAGGDLGRAAARLRRAAERLPLTGTLVLLAEVERALGNPAEARRRARPRRARSSSSTGRPPPRRTPRRVLFEADHGEPRPPWRSAASVWRGGAERALRRRAGLGADPRRPARRRPGAGPGAPCASARATRCSGSTPAWPRRPPAPAARLTSRDRRPGRGECSRPAKLEQAKEALPMRRSILSPRPGPGRLRDGGGPGGGPPARQLLDQPPQHRVGSRTTAVDVRYVLDQAEIPTVAGALAVAGRAAGREARRGARRASS